MKANNHLSVMKRLAVLLLVMCATISAFAQKVSVKGTVTDRQNEPIIGASILEQGTSNGVATDLDGNFTIQVDKNATLRISYIGYKTRTLKASAAMKIVLEEEANMLEEVKPPRAKEDCPRGRGQDAGEALADGGRRRKPQ